MSLKDTLERIEPQFEKGGKYEKWYALYEAVATILYTPGTVTKSTTHIRDRIDLKRIMILVWMMTFPAMFWGMYNVGNQAAMALAEGYQLGDAWQVGLFHLLGGDFGGDAGWGIRCGTARAGTYSMLLPLLLVASGKYYLLLCVSTK